jgi:hypothetical protein
MAGKVKFCGSRHRNGTEHQMHVYDNLEESIGLIIRGEERVDNKSLGGRGTSIPKTPTPSCAPASNAATTASAYRLTISQCPETDLLCEGLW